jgi:hypothetical protein
MTDAGASSSQAAVPVVPEPSPAVPAAPAEVELVPPPPNTSDWPAQATDTIVNLVDQVRAKTTGPAITVARGLVFGVIVTILGLMAGILLLIFAVRLTTDLLELVWDGAGVWLTYLIYGVLFTLVGAYLFGKRHVRGLE